MVGNSRKKCRRGEWSDGAGTGDSLLRISEAHCFDLLVVLELLDHILGKIE